MATTAPDVGELALFGALDEVVRSEFIRTLEQRQVQPGQVVYQQGATGRDMFVVLDGQLEMSKQNARGNTIRLTVIGPDECFGMVALVDVMPRPVTVRALTSTALLRIHARDLDRLYRRDLKAYSLLIMNIARELSRRLRTLETHFVDAAP